MEDIPDRLNILDNVQLRAELLKHGEKVGPVTPTTRSLFLSKLAQKVYAAEHADSTNTTAASLPGTEKGAKASTATRASSGSESGGVATVAAAALTLTPTGRKAMPESSDEKGEPCVYYVVTLADNSAANASNAGGYTVPGKFAEGQKTHQWHWLCSILGNNKLASA